MNYKEVIESRYNRQNWQLLLHDIFGSKIKFWSTPSIVATSSAFAKQALWLGTITLSDEQTIAVYEVELADSVDIERNRRGIRDMLLTTWRNNGNAGAFMFCYRKNESVLRFSYVSESWKFADDGSYQKESTDTRRFTYLLGEGHRSRTAIQQFERLRDSGLSLKDLTKAFSVDAVSDMFFDGYKKQYENIIFYITGKRMVKVANKWEERLEGQPCETIMWQFARAVGGDLQSPTTEKAVRDYVKKLMGRLVFLQFLQKKGWLGVGIHDEWGSGDPEFIQNLFKDCPDKDHFVNKVLNLLFNDLNTERKDDLSKLSTLNSQLIKIPYLNGGLFEREADDEMEFPLPAKYMQSLLDFFASYNFTIDENDPDDAEVGVDPEMLGRIFENLLEDNKDKGAFYTPKEIVGYMCRESLIAYLQTGIDDEPTKEAIRQFVTTHQVQELLPENTDQHLKDVKICDPAIGSGAFPMGLLKELFLCRTALEGISQHQAAEIKKHIIQQNVYGVDIERGAVDIARLRFWLSLIVDEETPQALPNLDFKIMQGNSLLEQYKGVDLSKLLPEKIVDEEIEIQATLFAEEFGNEQKELQDLINSYYDCTQHIEKKAIKEKISSTIRKQIHNRGITVDFGDLDLSGNNQFFLWHTWFHDVFSKGGFDIVIGNPPYGAKLSNLEKNLYRKLFPETQFKIDTYSLFVLHSLNVLRNNGFCYLIIPNTLLDNYFEEEVRKALLKNMIYEINDLSDKVFESAVVHSMIFAFCKNGVTEYNVRVSTSDSLGDINMFIPKSFFEKQPQCTYSIRAFGSNDLLEKLKENSVRLASVIDIRQAIKSGNDKLYIVERPLSNDYKPILRGKDIKKYEIINPHLYIKYGKHLACPRNTVIFEQPKILIREAGAEITATYDNNDFYIMSSLYNAILIDEKYSLKYILGLLNSKLFQFIMYKMTFEKTKGAFTKAKIFHYYELPVKKCSQIQQEDIINSVEKVLVIKEKYPSATTTAIEAEIDRLVYQLYGLTYDEVLIVDPETPITREEYEANYRR